MITLEHRKEIYALIKSDALPVIRQEDNDLMNIISSIWDVYQRKPTGQDDRFNNLGDEIDKHYFLNDDWSDDKLFIGLLKLFDDEHIFMRFLEELLTYYIPYDGFKDFVNKITPILFEDGIVIKEDLDEHNNPHAVRLTAKEADDVPEEDHTRKFYVCISEVTNAVQFIERKILLPEDKDCFILTFNYLWNDYDYKTRYRLYYYDGNQPYVIGELKIMKKGEMDTSKVLPKSFYSLGPEFCTLGNENQYYKQMVSLFQDKAYLYFRELRDTAIFSSIQKQFETEEGFITSLMRSNDAERLLRLGKFIVNGRGDRDAFSFDYQYHPAYNSNEAANLNFNFQGNCPAYQRLYALIGNNGVGKTTLLKDLIFDIIQNDKPDEKRHFNSLPPLFSCVMAISYSPFDVYPTKSDMHLANHIIDYEYCGLVGSNNALKDINTRVDELKSNLRIIKNRTTDQILPIWKMEMKEIFPSKIIRPILEQLDSKDEELSQLLYTLYRRCSSGESIFIEVVTSILAKIRYNSILLLDEPEQHLHPTGINVLIRAISNILERFDSFAIISTHSPFILREVPSSNVKIFNRVSDNLMVIPIGIETFGEDVSIISDFVFKNRNLNKIFEEQIQQIVVKAGYNYERAIENLRNNNIEPSLNTKLIVASLIENHKQ